MAEHPLARQPQPHSTTSEAGDDPDAGQVMGPHGESPEDPAARGLWQGCLVMFLVLGLVLATAVVLYRIFVTV